MSRKQRCSVRFVLLLQMWYRANIADNGAPKKGNTATHCNVHRHTITLNSINAIASIWREKRTARRKEAKVCYESARGRGLLCWAPGDGARRSRCCCVLQQPSCGWSATCTACFAPTMGPPSGLRAVDQDGDGGNTRATRAQQSSNSICDLRYLLLSHKHMHKCTNGPLVRTQLEILPCRPRLLIWTRTMPH